MQFEPI